MLYRPIACTVFKRLAVHANGRTWMDTTPH